VPATIVRTIRPPGSISDDLLAYNLRGVSEISPLSQPPVVLTGNVAGFHRSTADRDRDWDRRPSDFADPHRLVMRCRAHTRPAIDTTIAEVIKIQGRYSPKDANAKSG
jgi:hypothetical protein